MRLLLLVLALASSACWIPGRLRENEKREQEEHLQELDKGGATPCTLQCQSDRLACGRESGYASSCDKSLQLCLDICYLRKKEARGVQPSPTPPIPSR